MRGVDGHMSRRAQVKLGHGALVTYEGGQERGSRRDWRLEVPGEEPVGLGDSYGEADHALSAIIRARTGT